MFAGICRLLGVNPFDAIYAWLAPNMRLQRIQGQWAIVVPGDMMRAIGHEFYMRDNSTRAKFYPEHNCTVIETPTRRFYAHGDVFGD